ncbi:ATP-binding protein [Parasphingorhabdus sp.]|uniref:ATP-binding protein n=1 Tax=Parasphingorhabdus sp. TaxID=2709688 RepID=UPI003267EA6B
MDESKETKAPDQPSQRETLLQRRLARSEAARKEAEHLLDTKSRSLASAEEMLRQKEAALLEQVNRQTLSLVSAQTLANVATFHGDEDKRFIGSENFADVVGSKTPVTSFEQFAKMVHPDDQNAAMVILLDADRGELIGKNIRRDFRFCDDYGNIRWLRWSVTQERSADGVQFFGYGAVRNITEEREAERQEQELLKLTERRASELQALTEDLKAAREKAVAADKSKSRFLAMMSHDIRTPMNAILATLELLSISDLEPKQQKQVELARNSSDQLLFLLADIIEYARTDGWQFDLKMEEINLPKFVEGAADTWRPLARKKLLDITVDIATDCPAFILTDATRTRQIIDNFVSNAVKYTSNGQIDVSIEMSSKAEKSYFKLCVSDTGQGIAPDFLDRLFEDFDRGDADNSEIEGTGLGLSICKRIAEAMGGDIGVESEVDKGSKFWFSIPVTISDGSQVADKEAAVTLPKKLLVDGRPPKILVAEDVEANQIVIASMLETMGCEIIIVNDGSKVLPALENERFDGILMDVWMPTNGMTTTREIRSIKAHAKIPIYGVTAFAGDDERSAVLASGMDGVISKPINLAGLHYAIGQICGLGEQLPPPGSGNSDTIPDFGEVDVINIEKFQEQVLSVPEARREALTEAVVADIETWHDKFGSSWKTKDEKGVASAHHALRGICNGFGAYSLLEKIDSVHQNGKIGDASELLPIQDILEFTISAIRRLR